MRRAVTEDASQAEALLGRTYPDIVAPAYQQDVRSAALPLMTKAKLDLLTSGTFYVVEEAGKVLGCGGWVSGELGTGKTSDGLAHLRHFAVDLTRSRQGIGRLIFKECCRTASAQGVSSPFPASTPNRSSLVWG